MKNKNKTPQLKSSKNECGNKFLNGISNFKICKRIGYWWILPIAIILIAMIVAGVVGGMHGSITEGFNIGIDFEGGTMLSVKLGEESFTSNPNYQKRVNEITKVIESNGVKVSYIQTSEGTSISESVVTFRYKNIDSDDESIAQRNEKIKLAVEEKFSDKANADKMFVTYDAIGKTASNQLIEKASLALLISTLLILVYIIIRFETVSGIAAIITMIHDVLIMFCLTVICRVQINSSYVAAAITIIAYAINNTIIVFDRCRENLKPLKGKRGINYENIGDEAIRSTFTRQVYTTFTTMVTVVFLAILGGASLREFTIPIILGLIVGFYSSIFIATPLWSKMAYVAEDLRSKRARKKGAILYEKIDEKGEVVKNDVLLEENDENAVESVKVAGVKKQNAPVQRINYKKKNTQFKKKK